MKLCQYGDEYSEKRTLLEISFYQITSTVPLEMQLVISTYCMSQGSSRQAGSSSASQKIYFISATRMLILRSQNLATYPKPDESNPSHKIS